MSATVEREDEGKGHCAIRGANPKNHHRQQQLPQHPHCLKICGNALHHALGLRAEGPLLKIEAPARGIVDTVLDWLWKLFVTV